MVLVFASMISLPSLSLPTRWTGHWSECGEKSKRLCPPRVQSLTWPMWAAKVWTGSAVPLPLVKAVAAVETGGDAEVYSRKGDPAEIQRGAFSILCLEHGQQRLHKRRRFSWLKWLRQADPALRNIECKDLDRADWGSVFIQTVSAIRILEYMKGEKDYLWAATVPYAGKGQSKSEAAARRKMLVWGMEVLR